MKLYNINLILVAESTNTAYQNAEGVTVYAPRKNVQLVPDTRFSVEPIKGSCNVIVRGDYKSMYLSTLKQDYHKIVNYVYNMVYKDSDVEYTSNVDNYRVVNNYEEVLNNQIIKRIRKDHIRFTDGSISKYNFNKGIKVTFSGKEIFHTEELGDIYSPYFNKFEESPQKDGLDIALDRVNKSLLLGRDYNRIYKGLLKCDINVSHIRSPKLLNTQLSILRSIAASNAPVKSAESRIAETSISASPVYWRDTKSVKPINVIIPEGMKAMVKTWLRDDNCLVIKYKEDKNYKLVESDDFIHTVYKGVDLDPELTQYNRSRCDLTYSSEKTTTIREEGTFHPEWKDQIELEVDTTSTRKSWLRQFTLLDKLSDEEICQIIKYSIGDPDTTIFSIQYSLGYCIQKISQDMAYLKELSYKGEIYYKIEKGSRLYLDGIAKSKPGLDNDPEDDAEEADAYTYANDSDEIIEVFKDQYTVINDCEYLVFKLK